MSIRFASKEDCAAIAEIYNHAVLHTAAIWNDQTVDAENRISWYQARQLMGYPVLVSEENGVITGYASFGDWRNFDGFRHTVEHSVYVHPAHQGKGLGRSLLSRLIEEARACGKHVMVAGIESQNQASLHLHSTLGFKTTAQMPQVGTKFGRWLDLTFMQLQLDDRRKPDASR
ncbi:L-methionine sulfoximine/L-methionine sulfone acetyltransferase [Citrobacter braakii]|jgi:phosphinothricin acetyltransferase|uniref:GNAT family N-acetyltransferase n=1 Tax=Citrobacter TaxID=544 RepID=UPI00129967B6|nr:MULTISPECIES: L-methionine sulfoximine/L-methionine sulfone acetyltransferase [Citrobacter]MBU5641560.1 L-methionine sulfoximine/L-methionine sulfone acetyltransferase [Citrobacter sp. S46_ASV_140]MDU2942660.1 L-methionine sulfoximine/L-methionine sulfone acetyltransferase [Citrobacter sp.]MEB2304320.1 L-methionine sulfoximine/L-methionine sulfone acetyltransferase [Citrobacter braakii]QGG14620.1 L-methionine sulfoximine/L-methionine sulfone acetyltransferase [Citrobacter braakii]WFW24339.1